MKGAGGVADLLILALTDWIKRWSKIVCIIHCESTVYLIRLCCFRDKSEWQKAIENYVVNEFGANHRERDDFEKETHDCMEKFHENFYVSVYAWDQLCHVLTSVHI
jgi:hypothetical protein